MAEASPEELEAEIHLALNKLRGRLCGFLEACGLPERQERGAIQTLKSLSYDIESDLVDLVHDYAH